MALTEHELLHLNAVIRDAQEDLEKTEAEKESLSDAKQIQDYDAYLQKVIADTEAIIKSDVMPEDVKRPSDVHDYLEHAAAEEQKRG